MRIYDITVTTTPNLAVWPGDPSIGLSQVSRIEDGDMANISRLNMGVHTGTHIDAPIHFVPGGMTVEQLPLDSLVGPAVVLRIPDQISLITAEVLREAGLPAGTERILFKTRNSKLWSSEDKSFQTDFAAVSADGASYLVEQGIKLVGIDYLSIAPFTDSQPAHVILLQAGVIALEGLDLSLVNPGNYTLFCLPLKLGGADGAPARTILISED